MRSILGKAYAACKQILTEHIDQLHIVAQYLMKHEKVSGEVFIKLMKGELLDDTTTAHQTAAQPPQPKPGETVFEAAERAAEGDAPVPAAPAAPASLPEADGEPAGETGASPETPSPENQTE